MNTPPSSRACRPTSLFLMTLLLLASGQAQAGKVIFCVFDPLGRNGDAYNQAKDYALVSRKWGVEMELKPYTDERVAAEDFKAGQCDGVAITTVRARQFTPFTGSIDSVGALPTSQHMRALEALLANPKMAPRMINGPYEVAGIVPMGPAYVMVRDRRINSVEKAAGKRVAVLDQDKAQASIVQKLGAQPIAADITNFAGKFNNNQADIVVAPIVLYKPLELYKGVGTEGAIYRFPLGQVTASMLIRRDRFPPDFGQKCRTYALSQLDKAFSLIARAEREVPEHQWLDLSAADQTRYVQMMREARILLVQENIYDKDMMKLLKNLRCRMDTSNAECVLKGE